VGCPLGIVDCFLGLLGGPSKRLVGEVKGVGFPDPKAGGRTERQGGSGGGEQSSSPNGLFPSILYPCG